MMLRGTSVRTTLARVDEHAPVSMQVTDRRNPKMKQLVSICVLFLLPFLVRAAAPQIDVPDAAQPAVATAERFFAALSAGDLDKAAAELDPDVIILESGGAEHSAAEYLGHHAKEDAEFLKGARHTLGRRTARVAGELAWIASESELHTERDGKPMAIASTETMVLRSTPAGWSRTGCSCGSTASTARSGSASRCRR